MRLIPTLSAVALCLSLGSTAFVSAGEPEFFGESETLPASGPQIGKRLPYDLSVWLVNTPHQSVANTLD